MKLTLGLAIPLLLPELQAVQRSSGRTLLHQPLQIKECPPLLAPIFTGSTCNFKQTD